MEHLYQGQVDLVILLLYFVFICKELGGESFLFHPGTSFFLVLLRHHEFSVQRPITLDGLVPRCASWRCWELKEKGADALPVACWALDRLVAVTCSPLVVWRKHDILLQLRTDLFVDALVKVLLKLNYVFRQALPLPV